MTSDSSTTIRTLLDEPAVPNPPARTMRDYLLTGILFCTAAIEGVVRTDVPRPAITVPFVLALVFTLLWRRTKPLLMVLIVVSTILLADIVLLAIGDWHLEINTMIFILILFYALARWASGRHVVIGSLAVMVLALGSQALNYTGGGDLIGGVIVILCPIALGAAVRFQSSARSQLVERAKVQERETIARELHDTVAHRVSGIAIQAQAGQVQIRSGVDPDKVAKTLATIEEESSRTLTEMRLMVGTLRDTDVDDPAMAPQQGLKDIVGLSDRSIRPGLEVAVGMSGDLERVDQVTGAALFRIAQESVTNAARHATGATRVDIEVAVDTSEVRITVDDNGEAPSRPHGVTGFGLMGMSERAERLGGTFSAGPSTTGWKVDVTLPCAVGDSLRSTRRKSAVRSVRSS